MKTPMNTLEQALEALEQYPGGWAYDVDKCMWEGTRQDAIAALKEAIKQQEKTALAKFKECGGQDETDPVERLRFFCSLAMKGQDWLDVEPFFDAIKQQGEPVAFIRHHPNGSKELIWSMDWRFDRQDHTALYTSASAPTIPEGLIKQAKEMK